MWYYTMPEKTQKLCSRKRLWRLRGSHFSSLEHFLSVLQLERLSLPSACEERSWQNFTCSFMFCIKFTKAEYSVPSTPFFGFQFS